VQWWDGDWQETRSSASATGNAFGEHFGRLVPGLEQDVALADPVYRRSGDVVGAPSGRVQDPADAVLVESAGILRVGKEENWRESIL